MRRVTHRMCCSTRILVASLAHCLCALRCDAVGSMVSAALQRHLTRHAASEHEVSASRRSSALDLMVRCPAWPESMLEQQA